MIRELKELGFALLRIVVGLFILIEGLVVLDLIVYIGATGNTFSEKVMTAFESGYNRGYVQTYDTGQQEAYLLAYEKGFGKGFEIGLEDRLEHETSQLVAMHNPTYGELLEFLARDETDKQDFVSGEYVCFDFAAELNNKAAVSGIRAAYVRIRSDEWAHAVVAFETPDRGVVFVEPQSDRDIELVIGRPYPWWQVGARSPMGYNDPVLEIQVIW
jgi:hypothetical protein